jgi:RNA polymerase sigma factor for flagellar operon FliA
MLGTVVRIAAPAVADGRPAAGAEGAGPAARRLEALVREQLPLVGQVVSETLKRVPAHVGRDDLVSAAMFALAASAKTYDATRGVPFGQYAAIRIRGAVVDELRHRDWASRSVRRRAREVEEARMHLSAELGRSPSRDELAEAMGVDPRRLDSVAADIHRASVLSLQALAFAEAEALVPATGDEPEEALLRQEQLGYLRDAIAELPDRLRGVVLAYFFDQRSSADIADELGVTESRVSQLRAQALSMLRDAMRAAGSGACPSAPSRRAARDAKSAAYCAAVATRSTVTGRLRVVSSGGGFRSEIPRAEEAPDTLRARVSDNTRRAS